VSLRYADIRIRSNRRYEQQSGISSAVSDETARNSVVDTYRLHEQSAISATKSGALIATAWYRIKLKGKSVVAREREREKEEKEENN